ncbi:unnamed protein product [Prorocentrum cordatum]|uniref:Uncharacterized protein n=1 Tax=Prorocentrum cordatum TaxID=2364126 RepID=A0ABN9PGY9_9DINO|nr:unnamed protein product [Polarella glacialis]
MVNPRAMFQEVEAALTEQWKGKVARPELDWLSSAPTRCPTPELLAFGDDQDADAHKESSSALPRDGDEPALLEMALPEKVCDAGAEGGPAQAAPVRGVLGAEGGCRPATGVLALGAGREAAPPVPRRTRLPRTSGGRSAGRRRRRGRRRRWQPQELGGRRLQGTAPRGAQARCAACPAACPAARVALSSARGCSEVAWPVVPPGGSRRERRHGVSWRRAEVPCQRLAASRASHASVCLSGSLGPAVSGSKNSFFLIGELSC